MIFQMFEKSVIQKLSKIAHHNMKYIRHIDIRINNPKNVSKTLLFKSHIYVADIQFEKDDMYFTKTIKHDNFEKLTNEILQTINSEIKL